MIAEIRLNIQEIDSTGHIRVAIPTMCVGMLVVAALMMLLMACGCVPNGKGEDGDGGEGDPAYETMRATRFSDLNRSMRFQGRKLSPRKSRRSRSPSRSPSLAPSAPPPPPAYATKFSYSFDLWKPISMSLYLVCALWLACLSRSLFRIHTTFSKWPRVPKNYSRKI